MHAFFQVGDIVKCLRRVTFMDGTVHEKDSIHTIKQDDVAYFNVCHIDYESIEVIDRDDALSSY